MVTSTSSQHHQEGRWEIYDRHFCLKASATGLKDQSTIEIHLEPGLPRRIPRYSGPGTQPPPADRKICLEWNDIPSPNYPYPDCRFEHCCYRCIFNRKVTDNRYKALFCPYKGKRRCDPLPHQPTQVEPLTFFNCSQFNLNFCC